MKSNGRIPDSNPTDEGSFLSLRRQCKMRYLIIKKKIIIISPVQLFSKS